MAMILSQEKTVMTLFKVMKATMSLMEEMEMMSLMEETERIKLREEMETMNLLVVKEKIA
jgi:hypothetical protein